MENASLSALIVIVSSLLISCRPSPIEDRRSDDSVPNIIPEKTELEVRLPELSPLFSLLAKSKKSWLKINNETKGNYAYKITWSHPLTLNNFKTEIIVRNNKVIGRNHEANYPGFKPSEKWQERDTALGSHKDGMAASLLTLDELYKLCEEEILTRKAKCHTFQLDTFQNGIIRNCYFTPCGVADSTGSGVKINELLLKGGIVLKEQGESVRYQGCPDFYAPLPKECD